MHIIFYMHLHIYIYTQYNITEHQCHVEDLSHRPSAIWPLDVTQSKCLPHCLLANWNAAPAGTAVLHVSKCEIIIRKRNRKENMWEVSLVTAISQMKLLHFEDPNPNGHKSSKDDPKIPPKLSLGPLGRKVLQICWNGTLQTDHLAMAVFEG